MYGDAEFNDQRAELEQGRMEHDQEMAKLKFEKDNLAIENVID